MAGTREPIWARPERGTRGPQPEHSRAAIAAAAVVLADSGGLGAVTMRSVASALGTSAGSLYRYLGSREDLLDLMVDAAIGELPRGDPPAGEWLEDFIVIARELLVLYQRHPWLPETIRPGTSFGPRTMDFFERCLVVLEPVPDSTTTKLEAIGMTVGVVAQFAASAGTPVPPEMLFVAVTPEAHPTLHAALLVTSPPPPEPDLFGKTLRILLTGLLRQVS
ncbi:TetR/AcrR family transcriptional regulator [Winogradskya humida]|uniref:HTH tetR-type domain-containing protein n=1 Tax=Winogradskya humida TaxID=113566 RepID=A0ABQ3ZJW1_9ACTN|nr:TetR/AcrR family transcriptional regulator [Actinoplanes humidus]GIE18792.1 hypothetical protein Ahu01nite_018940 [Actinoplanes humidus]